ncbi:MAG: glycosyltransferase family 4 protein [Bryobacterales bacterium]|nr:glycosyltransferase family 4 protein [Bryobacterales bacterium]
MSLTIHLDATYAADPRPTGVANYSRELLFGLAESFPRDRYGFCYRMHRFRKSFQADLPSNARRVPLIDHLLPFRPRLFHGLNQRLPRLRMRRAVSTFHDLFVLTSKYSTDAFRERFALQARDAAARSDLAICVSAFTASQVEDLLGVPAARIRIIPHGVRLPDPASVRPAEEREPLILFVGALQKRKNVAALVNAFARVSAIWKLILIGGQGYGWEAIEAAVAASPARDRIQRIGYCDDKTLASYYSRAAIFAFPSLDEGFGMPVLEAMAWGLPVLTSNRSSLPEVAGDAALLVDPTKASSMEEGLVTLTESLAERKRLTDMGRNRAARCRWEIAVASTHAVYRELAG